MAAGRLLRFWAQSGTAQMPPARYPFRIATALPPPPPAAPAPAAPASTSQSPGVPTAPVRLVALDASPSVVNAGQAFTLTFRLSQSAPPGGITIGISSITTTGLTDALVVRPTAITIPGGQSVASTTIQTQQVTPDPTRIVFTAQLNGPQVGVQIEIR